MGWAASKKPTKILTNSPCIAAQLQRRCPGNESHANGRHASLFSGVAKQAQVHPPGLCDAICKGLAEQIRMDQQGQFYLATVTLDGAKATSKHELIANVLSEGNTGAGRTPEEDTEEELMEAWDDVSGKELDPGKVKDARKLEIDYIHKTRLYTKQRS